MLGKVRIILLARCYVKSRWTGQWGHNPKEEVSVWLIPETLEEEFPEEDEKEWLAARGVRLGGQYFTMTEAQGEANKAQSLLNCAGLEVTQHFGPGD